MKNATRILAIVFALALVAATVTNALLISDARQGLYRTVLLDESRSPPLRYLVMVIIPETDDSFFQGLVEGIQGQARASATAVQVFRYNPLLAGDASRFFTMAIKCHADGVIMYCTAGTNVPALTEEATRNGLTFVPVGIDPPAHGKKGFIGSGSLLHGMKAATLMGEELGNRARVGIILPGTGVGALDEDAFYRGVALGLGSWPGARIVQTIRAGRGLLSGEEATASLLRDNPVINAVFCSSAQDTEGAAQVIVDRNLVGKVVIVGADETPEIRRFIDKGVVTASIIRDSRRIGENAIAAFGRLKAGAAPGPTVETGFSVRTRAGLVP